MPRAEAEIDLGAVAHNVRRLRQQAGNAAFMAVVKADGYGHGMVPCAQTALANGADYLGVALPAEARELRAVGITAPILTWLYSADEDLSDLVAADVDISAASLAQLEQVLQAGRKAGRPVRLHLKVDTGLGRNGAARGDWPQVVERAAAAISGNQAQLVGLWSHLASADEPDSPVTGQQVDMFAEALAVATAAGLSPRYRHLANTGGLLNFPETHYDLVRVGIGLYGLSPGPASGTSAQHDLRPAMSVRAQVTLTKVAPADYGVSYGHTYRTSNQTTLALIPLGYADGIPRAGSNLLPVQIGGHRARVAGTVAMDQFVVDCETAEVVVGDEVILFGAGSAGEPTADDWAALLGTINYEIVTRMGPRLERKFLQP